MMLKNHESHKSFLLLVLEVLEVLLLVLNYVKSYVFELCIQIM